MHGGDVWREGAPGDWLDFSANIRPGGPPDWVREALLAGIGDVSYYPDLRMERARAALGAYLNLGPDWVLPTAGGISAIALAMRLDAPEVIVFGPCFGEYAEIAADCGAKVRELTLLAGREPMSEASLSAAPTSAPRERCERGELSATSCGSAFFAASASAPQNGYEPGELSEILREGAPCAAPGTIPLALSRESASSIGPHDHRELGAYPVASANLPCEGRGPNESPATSCRGAAFVAPISAPCEGCEPGKLFEVSREGVLCVAPKGIPLALSRESASSIGSRDHRELGAHPVASANPPCEDRGPNESPATSCGGASFAAAESLKAVISRESASSMAPRDHCELGAHPVASANLPCEGRGPNESPATLRGGASFAASSPASLEQCAADALPPALCDRRALAMPSEVLRGNMTPGAAVWLCNPLNPVGAAFPRTEIEALLGIVEAADGWLVLDEAFVHCCPERTSADLLAAHPRLAIVGSLTKSLGIPGARAGYVCANPDVLGKLARRQRSWELNCFAESVIRALPDHAAELRAEAETNAARREALRRGLEALGAYVYPSEACFLLADFGRDVSPLVNRLREKGILVRQCTDFHGIDDGRHLRLAVKDEAANGRLIEALREALGAGSC